jgi:diguanylate cyclase (GGDEF)-like protein
MDRSIQRQQGLPPEVYLPLVDSLYQNGQTLLLATLCVTCAAFITYLKTSEILLLYCTLAIVIVACARGLLICAYLRAQPTVTTTEAARRWERSYVGGAAASIASLGIWCYVAFTTTPDSYAHLVSFSMTIVYMAGIFARNYGNPRFVVVQCLCAWIPMAAALALYGNPFDWIFAGLLAPFFLGIKLVADRLRRALLDAVIASRNMSMLADDMSLLARQFDVALNNMPHGLCMLDSNRRILVSNQKLREQLELQPGFELKGSSWRRLTENLIEVGLISDVNGHSLIDRLESVLSVGSSFIVDVRHGRTLEVNLQPMENGGVVIVTEDITERRIAEDRINRLARFDPLTGLPNRITLHDCMERTVTKWPPGSMCAIHFIDLDQFKQINDTLGHTHGDMLLKAVANRLQSVAREADVIARFGGDEFVILQAAITSADQAETLANRVQDALAGSYDLDGHKVVITASIGIASAIEPIDPDQFLRNADMALYRAKTEGRGTWRWFEGKMETDAQARRNLELDLRQAVESEVFELYYQPIFDRKARRIVACEALLRWPHAERGLISAAEFIPVAEEMGLIVEIGNQALLQACQECCRWPGDTAVTVNFSSIQFEHCDVAALVRETLAVTNLPANRLEIEITESTLLQNTMRTRVQLHQLAEAGVTISLDDFGTAYSGLSYLHTFPLHKVKFDRSFLQDLHDNERRSTLLRGLTRLSAQLGLRVVVEGVETDEQLELLGAEDSIDEVQGYLLGKPIPASDLFEQLGASHVSSARTSSEVVWRKSAVA